MKNTLIPLLVSLCILSHAQTTSNIQKLKKTFEVANNMKDFKDLLDGDTVAAICSLLTGKAVCSILSVTPLNSGEEAKIKLIKSKYAFEQWLINRGIKPDDFYKKIGIEQNTETIQSRLTLKKINHN